MYSYNTLKELEELSNKEKIEVWKIIQKSDMEENGRTEEKCSSSKLHQKSVQRSEDRLHTIAWNRKYSGSPYLERTGI